ncbi:hypothetical protein OH779_39955 [Actinacidiphila glaucinigra]|uniref:hypothetical protein n=1 Tax=Actinacidiphila glaucinigra TaxID=235986 RepID=UPI00386834AA
MEDNWDIDLAKEVQLNWASNTEQDLADYHRSTQTPVALTKENLVSGAGTNLKSACYEETPPATGDWYLRGHRRRQTRTGTTGARTATFQTWAKKPHLASSPRTSRPPTASTVSP